MKAEDENTSINGYVSIVLNYWPELFNPSEVSWLHIEQIEHISERPGPQRLPESRNPNQSEDEDNSGLKNLTTSSFYFVWKGKGFHWWEKGKWEKRTLE